MSLHWLKHLDPGPSDPDLRLWLQQEGSTTKRLNQIYGPQAQNIKITQSQWGILMDDEIILFEPSKRYWIREVVLYINHKPWMWARSCFPEQTLASFDTNLGSFKDSLGYLLFSDPSLQRSAFSYTSITKAHPFYQAAIQYTETKHPCLWGRRSMLHFRQKPLLLTEVFLPDNLPQLSNKIDG